MRVSQTISAVALPTMMVTIGRFLYFRNFAIRIPDRKLIRTNAIVMWGYCTSTVLMEIMGILSMAFSELGTVPTGVPPPSFFIFYCSMGLLGLVLLGFTVWLFILLFRMRKAFRTALHHAQPAHSRVLEGPVQ